MTQDEALETARAEWATYAEEAKRLGFDEIEERIWEWTERGRHGHSAHLFFYRAPTFLDLYVSVPDGTPPRGILPGFGGVQLYTFFRAESLAMALTNGSPPGAPESKLGAFIDRIAQTPEDHQVYRMINGASDLQAVVERHQRVIGRRTPLVPDEPILEQRWTWMEELENMDDDCC
jgi:hypothetical protein